MKIVTAYRIVRQKYSEDAFTGEGTRIYGGRWNSAGKMCVYAAGSESLAILEMLVHLERRAVEEPCLLFKLRMTERDVVYLGNEKLPNNWRRNPSPRDTALIGDRWLESGKNLALGAPSAVVPREWVYILNPKHKKFRELAKKAEPLQFEFDPRLV